ncbi:MAG: dihydrodipicolinate synthase family protein [Verrucomicrobiales bacterium]|nr:dihydrodipicolinate synthase family protein [Verrucomicrobiales bacterium]
MDAGIKQSLERGMVIPACPLALTNERTFDEQRQRALIRYYHAAGAGGLAIGVHTTQFAIRDPQHGLYKPVLELAKDELDQCDATGERTMVRVGGICGQTAQAVREAGVLAELGYHAGLLNLGALGGSSDEELFEHCKAVAEVIPVFGFYLQASVGGCELPFSFWRRFAEIENIVAIKIAAFDRYQTIDVIRALAETDRSDISLYTGNDDNIVMDLLTPYRFDVDGKPVERRFVGGLLGHWAVWTSKAVELLEQCHRIVEKNDPVSQDMLRLANEVTDCNAVLFDASHDFRGCIPGLEEVLCRQGLLSNNYCLDPKELLSPGQAEEIDRICRAYPHLTDDEFVTANLKGFLS